MKILVGCEESGIVRNAFGALGHEAFSNDLVDSRNLDYGRHLRMDVFRAIAEYAPWDIIILHPPCTALAVSGNHMYGAGMKKNDERYAAKIWTKRLWELACNVARIGVCLENPVGVIWNYLGITPQYIQPYQFGHPEQKKTGLGLFNLPPLVPTNDVYSQMMQLPKSKRQRILNLSPSADRQRLRSETYKGVAEAMANQWSAHAHERLKSCWKN